MKSDEPLMVGRALTRTFLLFVFLLAVLPQRVDGGWTIRLLAFLAAPANEIGDTLAGVAGVLAFLWIIITVWLQSQELAEQRKELSEQREATQAMARAQEKQVEILQRQGEIFEDEQRQRRELHATKLLDQWLQTLRIDFRDASLIWRGPKNDFGGRSSIRIDPDPNVTIGGVSNEAFFLEILRQMRLIHSEISKKCANRELIEAPSRHSLRRVYEDLVAACGIFPDLGEPEKILFRRLKLDDLRDTVELYLKSNIWPNQEDDT